MSLPRIDNLALHAAVQRLLSDTEDGWREAAQTIVDAAIDLPVSTSTRRRRRSSSPEDSEIIFLFSHVSSGAYILVHRGDCIEIAPKHEEFDLTTREGLFVFFDSRQFAHTVATVQFHRQPLTLAERALPVHTVLTSALGRLGTMLLYAVSFGAVRASFLRKRTKRTYAASEATIRRTTCKWLRVGSTLSLDAFEEFPDERLLR